MRTIPVDTKSITTLVGGPIQAATSPDGSQRRDKSGRPLFQVPVIIVSEVASADTVVVRVPGPVAQVAPLTPVTFVGLVARPWSMEGRSGVSFSAEAMQPTQTKQ